MSPTIQNHCIWLYVAMMAPATQLGGVVNLLCWLIWLVVLLEGSSLIFPRHSSVPPRRYSSRHHRVWTVLSDNPWSWQRQGNLHAAKCARPNVLGTGGGVFSRSFRHLMAIGLFGWVSSTFHSPSEAYEGRRQGRNVWNDEKQRARSEALLLQCLSAQSHYTVAFGVQ